MSKQDSSRNAVRVICLLLLTVSTVATAAFTPNNPNFIVAKLSQGSSKQLDASSKLDKSQISGIGILQLQRLQQQLSELYQQSPNDVTIARNRLLVADGLHDFQTAAETLQQLKSNHSPRSAAHAQLSLQRVNALIGLGRYQQAKEECHSLENVAPTWYALCAKYSSTLIQQPANAMQATYKQLAAVRSQTQEQLRWQQEVLADIALRLDQTDLAKQHCKNLMALNPSQAQQFFCFTTLQTPLTMPLASGVPALLIQYLNASDDAEEKQRWRIALREEEISAAAGSSLHLRELAMFALAENRPNDAFEWARQNWNSQKFPEDAYLLRQTAAMAQLSRQISTNEWRQQWPFDLRPQDK